MQSTTIIVIFCLIATVYSYSYGHYPAVDSVLVSDDVKVNELISDTPVHERSPRTKRGLLLLKKKLLLGAVGLGAAKVVGAGVVGALALKAKPKLFG